jgi:hypothetical protein
MSRDKRGDGIQEVVSSILIGSTNSFNNLHCAHECFKNGWVSNSRLISAARFEGLSRSNNRAGLDCERRSGIRQELVSRPP